MTVTESAGPASAPVSTTVSVPVSVSVVTITQSVSAPIPNHPHGNGWPRPRPNDGWRLSDWVSYPKPSVSRGADADGERLVTVTVPCLPLVMTWMTAGDRHRLLRRHGLLHPPPPC